MHYWLSNLGESGCGSYDNYRKTWDEWREDWTVPAGTGPNGIVQRTISKAFITAGPREIDADPNIREVFRAAKSLTGGVLDSSEYTDPSGTPMQSLRDDYVPIFDRESAADGKPVNYKTPGFLSKWSQDYWNALWLPLQKSFDELRDKDH